MRPRSKPMTIPTPPKGKAREGQEERDRFYWAHGPCCSGCDWWAAHNSAVGECRRSAPVSGSERTGMLSMASVSLVVPSGHPLTPRDHYCGDFKDGFNWSTLPLTYLKRVGAPSPSKGNRDGYD